MVAMVNKDLLPFTINVPFIGETIFFSQALKFNVEILLFKSPWAPFDKWNLKEDYKRLHKKQELVEGLKSKILLLAILNFLLMPLILLYQILRFFFYYVELVKREPGTLGVRRWSPMPDSSSGISTSTTMSSRAASTGPTSPPTPTWMASCPPCWPSLLRTRPSLQGPSLPSSSFSPSGTKTSSTWSMSSPS
ncbi:Autophagy-related protein 9 [Caligus rogercresseyi]|uniref:Autophagy-related protein 9 n=1 Tax=Caligus rogercresseyi TaxID=217165 RepID=A0A7T8KI48_CALRO|nr:Autophagy-related protein 9 [Caligus rogercresseyi]